MKSRYIIKECEGSAHGGLNELEINYYFDVYDKNKKKGIMTFSDEYSASLGSNGNWMVSIKLKFQKMKNMFWCMKITGKLLKKSSLRINK